ncbi:MAG: metallophosphoesterase [Pirellulales bacterium]
MLVYETAPVRVLVLDSLLYVNQVAGLLGKAQRQWLTDFLSGAPPKPTVLFVHHTLGDGDGELLDADRLFDIIEPHQQVKAVFYGHSHQYRFERRTRATDQFAGRRL